MPIEIQIGQLMEEVSLGSFGLKGFVQQTRGFEIAKAFIKNKSASVKTDISCSVLPGCNEKARKIIVQLLMLNWNIYGVGSSTMGLSLANHYSALGPYFGNKDGHNWPHIPLSKAPLPLETAFHEKMVEVTKILSNGKLSNISILDLPAFGSSIAWLKKQHKRAPNWPTEMNFAVLNKMNFAELNQSNAEMSEVFEKYKVLLTHWDNYMNNISQNNPHAIFTPEMGNNTFFNFTNYIRADLRTFLIAIHGSTLTASNQTLPIWKQLGSMLLNSTNGLHDNMARGLYDKLIMQCGFKQDISQTEHFTPEGGCHLFDPTLTTNGMCYTFNGAKTSDIWKSTELTNLFKDIFSWKPSKEVYREAGKLDGKVQSNNCNYFIKR